MEWTADDDFSLEEVVPDTVAPLESFLASWRSCEYTILIHSYTATDPFPRVLYDGQKCALNGNLHFKMANSSVHC